MDPLSISASIAGLMTLTSTVISHLSDVRNGPKELQRIRSEVFSMLGILMMLQDQMNESGQADPFSSSLRSLFVPNGPFQQLRKALENLSSKLAPVAGLKKVGEAMKWPIEKKEILEIMNIIERQKAVFILARQNDHIALSRAIGTDIGNMQKRVEEVNTGFTNLQINEKRKKIHYWLSAPDPSWNYNEALQSRHANSGDWFFKTDIFLNWLLDNGRFLWLNGIPGCGKTILSSAIIQRIKLYCQSQKNMVVLYFFFDFNNVEKQSHEKMIRSLLTQLSSQCLKMPQALELLYSSCENGERQPTSSLLLTTLNHMMTHFETVYLVIDALDECSKREELFSSIKEFFQATNLHILVTSRKEKDIEDSIKSLCNDHEKICIQSMLVSDDIRAYIRNRLQVDQNLKRWQKYPLVQLEIEDELMSKADGMFRWVACQLDSLKNCLNLRELRKALRALPKNLDETYIRILCNIKAEHSRYALKILQWLAFSTRPLELEELAEIVAIDVRESPRFDPENRFSDLEDVFTICSSLISKSHHDENSTTVINLAHLSVKEFLLSRRILQGEAKKYGFQEIDANISIYNDCLAYLLELERPSPPTPEFLAQYPLAMYAAKKWTKHAQVVERSDRFEPDLVTEFFFQKEEAFLNWIRLYNSDDIIDSEVNEISRGMRHQLYYASLTGLHKSVHIILERGADINAPNDTYHNALRAASMRGHEKVVQSLLKNGAEINAQSKYYGNAIQAASMRGHEKVVEILLENGADIHAQNKYYGNALQAASKGGHEKVVEILLKNGADVNAQSGYLDGNALIQASAYGHEKVVKILLKNGADVNAQNGKFKKSALLTASTNGHEKVVEILLKNGADVNSQNRYKKSALLIASTNGHERVVEVLLRNGADINAEGGYHGNALRAASVNSHENIVGILLDNGVNIVDNSTGSTPLHEAASHGQLGIVKLFLDKSFNFTTNRDVNWSVNVDDKNMVSKPLQGAKNTSPHWPNAMTLINQTPLHLAASRCHKHIILHLLNHGADANLHDGYGLTSFDYVRHDLDILNSMKDISIDHGPTEPLTQQKYMIKSFLNTLDQVCVKPQLFKNTGYYIGHCLLLLKDQKAACYTLQQYGRAECDACSATCRPGKWYVCTECVDTDLCTNCMLYPNEFTKPRCQHEFLEIPKSNASPFSMGITHELTETQKNWLKELQSKYKSLPNPG